MASRNPAQNRRGALARLLAAVLALWAAATLPAAAADEGSGDGDVLVFAAASLKNALDEIAAGLGRETGDKVTVAYAASSALARQIEQGAPADLFVSADLDWMDYLEQRGLIAKASRRNLLGNRLVLIAPKESGLGEVRIAPGLDLAGLLNGGRLAMADVRAVPAGKYGKAALEKLGAWRGVESRLAQAENVRAALALVSRGEAPLGIVYRTDAAADPRVRIVGVFPEDAHPPIIYPVALTATGAGKTAAAAFLAHLRGSAAKAAFERQGFTMLDAPAS
jgi:molybdate transport system substrate-binding protein